MRNKKQNQNQGQNDDMVNALVDKILENPDARDKLFKSLSHSIGRRALMAGAGGVLAGMAGMGGAGASTFVTEDSSTSADMSTSRGHTEYRVWKEGLAYYVDGADGLVTSSSDPIKAVNDAIYQAPSLGVKISLPNETLETTTELKLPSESRQSEKRVTVEGHGMGNTLIQYIPTSGYAIRLESNGTYPCHSHIFKNFSINAPNTKDGMIALLGSTNNHFQDIETRKCPYGKGIYGKTYGGWSAINNNFIGIKTLGTVDQKWCVYFDSKSNGHFFGCQFTNATQESGAGGIAFYQNNQVSCMVATQLSAEVNAIELDNNAELWRSHVFINGGSTILRNNSKIYGVGGHDGYVECKSGCEFQQFPIDIAGNRVMEIQNASAIPDFSTKVLDCDNYSSKSSGVEIVTDANASNGKAVKLDAQTEWVRLDPPEWKGWTLGKYMLIVFTKDTNQISDDLKIVGTNMRDSNNFLVEHRTCTPSYTPHVCFFTLDSDDANDEMRLQFLKDTADTNSIYLDFAVLVHLGSHWDTKIVKGGADFIVFNDSGELPIASKDYRGWLALHRGGGNNNQDTLKMCMKNSKGEYTWATIYDPE